MTPLLVYITRPYAYEIYMGGKRDLSVWLEKPYYSHQSRSYELGTDTYYVDIGWRSAFATRQRAKLLFEQDERLLEVIWPEVFLSICPKGMSYEEGKVWADTPDPSKDDPDDTLYRALYEDKEWEGKCNTSHKRFLLEVDLRSYAVRRITPGVSLRNSHAWAYTDEIDPKLAVQHFHNLDEIDDIPF